MKKKMMIDEKGIIPPSSSSTATIQRRTWKRILYEKQPYRDNFYDPQTFFSQLRIITASSSSSNSAAHAAVTTTTTTTTTGSASYPPNSPNSPLSPPVPATTTTSASSSSSLLLSTTSTLNSATTITTATSGTGTSHPTTASGPNALITLTNPVNPHTTNSSNNTNSSTSHSSHSGGGSISGNKGGPNAATGYFQAFTLASLIAQQFTSLTFFFSYYRCLIRKTRSFQDLAILDSSLIFIILLVAYCLNDLPNAHNQQQQQTFFLDKIKVGIIFTFCLRLAAPILQTLTISFSEDTIYALAITFSALHLAFHDYAYVNSSVDYFSGTTSLNAAIFTAILLASRFQEHNMVMGLILLAVIVFGLFPVLARLVKAYSIVLHWILVFCQWIVTSYMLYSLDWTLFVVFEVLQVVLMIITPVLYMKMQVWKRAYHGPWDIK